MKPLTGILCERRALLLTLAFGLAVSGCVKTVGRNANPNSNQPVATPTAIAEAIEVKPVQQPTPATEKNNILFIIDSSGSMRTKAGNKTKMEAAKEVVTGLIGHLPAETQAGLMAYGHRQKNDCKDVELLVPIGPVQPDVFSQKVLALQPLGETPISFSIRQAADVLKARSGKKTVILISDGEETCKEDPCVVAAELKKADVALQVHVVGFGIDSPLAKKQLNCIAAATGGTYKDAGNADDLKKSLEGMAKAAEPPVADRGELLTTSRDSYGNPIHYLMDIYRAGDESRALLPSELHLDNVKGSDDGPLLMAPGIYSIKYNYSEHPTIWRRNVEIKAGQRTQVDLGDFGRMRFSIKDQNGNPVEMYSNVLEPGETNTVKSVVSPYKGTKPELLPGMYDVMFWGPPYDQVWSKGIVVKAGQETVVEVTVSKH